MSLVQPAHFLQPVEMTSDNPKIGWPDCACCLLLSSFLFCGDLKIGTGKCHKTCLSAGTGSCSLQPQSVKLAMPWEMSPALCVWFILQLHFPEAGSCPMCIRQLKVFVSLYKCFNFFYLKLRHNNFCQSLKEMKNYLLHFCHSNLPL